MFCAVGGPSGEPSVAHHGRRVFGVSGLPPKSLYRAKSSKNVSILLSKLVFQMERQFRLPGDRDAQRDRTPAQRRRTR